VIEEQVFTSICEAIKTGISLRQSCHHAGIDPRTFYDAVEASPERSQRYARARNIQTEMLADELVQLADSATPRDAHVKRLQIDTRRWIAAKLLPRKYGDKPAEINVSTQVNVAVISEADRQALIAKVPSHTLVCQAR
jgi:hypothetical protein